MNLWNYKVSSKTKKNKFGTKNVLLWSLAGMLKNYFHISNQRPPNCLIAYFHAEIRIFKFGVKNALFGCFGQQFWKTIVIFEISTLEFALLQSFEQRIKILKFGTKMPDFPYFGAGIWNIIVIFEISVLEFALLQSLVQK